MTTRNGMHGFRFDNRFVRELPGDPLDGLHRRQVHGAVYSRVRPTPVAAPRLLAWSPEMAALLGLDAETIASTDFAQVMAGNALLEGMEPYSGNYGGHQFGSWAGQLGDGRAITLGEMIGADGARWELQLKGAGPTPYSRTADGRAVLRSSVREFLCSEAVHHLGVPTTRALCLVATGEQVMRDMFYDGRPELEPGAIVCRVAPSFIRFGHFELPSAREDLQLLERLVDFTIRRDFPALIARAADDRVALRGAWYREVCERTARMVAHWMRVGFVHGVMNTDNMSILGLTIDYGPYGWIDDYDPEWTPNTTDAGSRRYRFGNQAQIAYWNLGQLANALLPLLPSPEPLEAGLRAYVQTYVGCERANIAGKLGLLECRDEDVSLMDDLRALLQAAEVDMTLVFRALADVNVRAPTVLPLQDAFYDPQKAAEARPQFEAWLARYAARVQADGVPGDERRARMNAVNPKYVLRNYLAQEAIDRAVQGDTGGIVELLDVMRRPYDDQPGRERFARRRPEWARDRPGCSMLSCSS